MGITIKEIAEQAEVSIATVSHVINKTRYVSPDLVNKVEDIIRKTGYNKKMSQKANNHRVGKSSKIAIVIPNIGGTIYAQLCSSLFNHLQKEGYILPIYLTYDDLQCEKYTLLDIMADRNVSGLILIPVSEETKNYKKLILSRLPFICLDRAIKNENVESIVFQNYESIILGMEHLIKNGHERIGIILENNELTTVERRLKGYKDALSKFNIHYREDFVILVDLYNHSDKNILEHITRAEMPTAFIAGGNTLTLKLLRSLEDLGLECPNDVSVIGFGDDEWCSVVTPPLTTLTQNIETMAKIAADRILEKIQGFGVEGKQEQLLQVPANLTIRKSTQVIGRGPFGEKALHPRVLELSEEDIQRLKKGNFKVGISFHYTGTEWTILHEQAIRETFNQLEIKLIAIMDANFDPELQEIQLDSLIMQKPDAIISVPSDEEKSAKKFKEISKKTKLILINNMPNGFVMDDYSTWISVNERENGQNAAKLLGEYFKEKKLVNVALLVHGTPFFATQQRDFAVEQTLLEYYPNINIVAKEPFINIDDTYDVCERIVTAHPEIQGFYISWDCPAFEAIRLLKKINRTDIVIVTTDLGKEIASYIAREEMVIGLSTQKPYEQGVAVALATANALLGKTEFKSIGTQPILVTRKNLSKAWHEIMRTPEPEFIKEIIK